MEKQIETRFSKRIRALGGIPIKLQGGSFTGLPDRLNLLPGGRLFFAEFKYGGNKLSMRQEAVIRILRGLGFEVWVVDEFNIDDYIKQL